MQTSQQQPRDSILKLVQHVFDHRDGLIEGVTYEALAKSIGRTTKHGKGHAHGMGSVLSRMGHLLNGIQDEWGEAIPQLHSLVTKKTGTNQGLPDDGIKEFWPDYPKMARTEKWNRVRIEYERIVSFGSRWNEVLAKLDLQQLTASASLSGPHRVFGSGGESIQHKNFKEYVRQHPEIVSAQSDCESFVEYPLPTCDQIDVVFKSSSRCIAVEVKSSLSDRYPFDYERGLFQTIKYGALLSAMASVGGYSIPPTVESVLVLESTLPGQYRSLATRLGIKIFEGIKMVG